MAAPTELQCIGPATYELPIGFRPEMRAPVRVYGTEKLVAAMDDQVFQQAANVATLPGIVEASLCMPDAHWGYGFPIGGVAAIDVETGVISPGGIGFDINCGMRLVRTDLAWPEVRPRLRELVDALAKRRRVLRGAAGGRPLGRPQRLRRGGGSRLHRGRGALPGSRPRVRE
jgi:tRNA-splicing ligase RtcB